MTTQNWTLTQKYYGQGELRYLTETYELYRPGKTLAIIYDAKAATIIGKALGIEIQVGDEHGQDIRAKKTRRG